LFDTEFKKLQADLNALADQYEKDQRLYDEKSKHGANQKAYDPAGKNIEYLDPGLKLLK
jgi:PDZ domain-containing secreted protein